MADLKRMCEVNLDLKCTTVLKPNFDAAICNSFV